MPAKKKPVNSPLQLLQQLSYSLVEHLEKACADARKEAEGLLAKLEKQRSKTRDKLVKARAKLDDAGAAGKARAQGKARARIDELEDALALLDARQRETLDYLRDLDRDTQQSLKLAAGIRQVGEAAGQAAVPEKAVTAPVKTRKRSAARAPESSPEAAAERAPAAARKPRPSRAASSKVNPEQAIALPDGETAVAAEKKSVVLKPAARKATARKPAGSAQAPVSSS